MSSTARIEETERWRTVVLDDEAMWPTPGKVALPPANVDERGAIQSIVNFPMKNLSLISSRKGTVRSNHYHITDWHYMYVLRGSFDYYYRPTGSDAPPQVLRFTQGEMVFTPPMEDHATVFLEDTELMVVSRNPRDQATYESDVRRVNLVDPETLGAA
jgi:dTDP-4-dehydrorhamnose 3,5-epimerase-like enzyme